MRRSEPDTMHLCGRGAPWKNCCRAAADRFALANRHDFRRNALANLHSMDLGDILGPEQINPELQASNRWEAIDELINLLVQAGKIKPENLDSIVAVVKKRESSMSTGIGFGIGIPH